MKLVAIRLLRGPNIHFLEPCGVALLEMEPGDERQGEGDGPHAAAAADPIPLALAAALRRALPDLRGLAAADRWTPAEAVGRIALLLQRGLGREAADDGGDDDRLDVVPPAPGPPPRLARVAVGYRFESVGERALRLALQAVTALSAGQPWEPTAARAELRGLADRRRIDARSEALLAAARHRGIPVLRLSEDERRFQLGWGHRQRRIDLDSPGPEPLDALFPPGDDSRIPSVAITGTNGKTTTTLMIDHVLARLGLRTGTTTTSGIAIDGRTVERGDCTGYWSARRVLLSDAVEVAVLETARGGIVKRGLAFDRCDVGVVLNVSGDHLGLDGVETLADLARVKGLVARCAARAAVLNAEDALCLGMRASLRPGCEPVLFSMDPANPVLRAHLQAGGRAAWLDDAGWLVWRDPAAWPSSSPGSHPPVTSASHRSVTSAGDPSATSDGRPSTTSDIRPATSTPSGQPLARAADLPATMQGHARYNIANALAALAAAICLGQPPAAVAVALASFVSDAKRNPLRSNLFTVGGVGLVVDYAHNVAACRALCAMARSRLAQTGSGRGRLIGVVTAPGDRRDADLQAVGEVFGECVDELVVYEQDPRGRAPGAIIQTICAGSRLAGTAGGQQGPMLHAEPQIRAALARGLALAHAGDIVVFTCAGSLADLVDGIRRVDPSAAAQVAAAIESGGPADTPG